MNNNDIIKALDCCGTWQNCSGCPMLGKRDCISKLCVESMHIINRQKAEIESLGESVRLQAEMLYDARSKAIKEFAERLCDGKVSNDPVVIAAECAVKEMTEVRHAETD